MARAGGSAGGGVFISYRRSDSALPAALLYEQLAGHFGAGHVFKDVDSIAAGDDFTEAIRTAIDSCDTLLVVIGQQWLTVAAPGGGRRLDAEDDLVRAEVEAALARGVRVVPVLVTGAQMPDATALPPSLRPLTRRQAHEIDSNRFRDDTDRLIRALERARAEAARRARAEAARPTPTPPPPPTSPDEPDEPDEPDDGAGDDRAPRTAPTDAGPRRRTPTPGTTPAAGPGRPRWTLPLVVAVLSVAALVAFVLVATKGGGSGAGATASSAADGTGGTGGTAVSVLMVGNPQMEDIQKLTAETFTRQTGIPVNFTILPENELRDRITEDIATGGGRYDVASVGAFEVPIWAKNGWLREVGGYARADAAFDAADLLPSMTTLLSGADGKLYGLPFYGESSFLMYRKDVFAQKGLTMPEHPTWDQVAQLAAQVDGAQPGMRGICLRGLPGWGELGAPLSTVVNTFGGTWFTRDWQARVDAPEFEQATRFYVDLVRRHGEAGAAQSGFTECLNAMSQGTVAMWYDATSAAGSLEDPSVSEVAGKVGYAAAPVKQTSSSGWLWAWSWSIPADSKNADNAARFVLWATSKDYENVVGRQLGWARVPAGKRASTYGIPDYRTVAAPFADLTLQSIRAADPTNPGVQPRPTVGVQYVAVPEFTDVATKITRDLSAAIDGDGDVGPALANGQQLAQQVATRYQGR